MKRYTVWLLKIILPIKYGRIITGVLIALVLYPFFSIGGVSEVEGSTPALFFSLIIAYIVPIYSYVTERLKLALLELEPIVTLDKAAFSEALAMIDTMKLNRIIFCLIFGVVIGVAHLSLINGSLTETMSEAHSSLIGFTSLLGTILVWIVMTTVSSSMIQQVIVFSRIGSKNTKLSLLNTRKLLPFARVSILSSLAIIGAVALFPFLTVDSRLDLFGMLPGAVATAAPLFATVLIPVWPLHKRLLQLKEQELEKIDIRISALQDGRLEGDIDDQALTKLSPLVNYRRIISEVSVWPYDGGAISRFGLYLIIPPLAWVGAALVENLVDSLL